jgi:hypothetical protein
MRSLFLLNLLTLSLFGQTENTLKLAPGVDSPAASLEAASWLTGGWEGEGLGGICEEIWSPAKAGTMLGMFRIIKDGKQAFSEFMEIKEQDGSILLRLKHFGNDFEGWEEKDKHITFKLVKETRDALYFDGLTYRKKGDLTMEVFVVFNSKEGVREEKFTYRRQQSN